MVNLFKGKQKTSLATMFVVASDDDAQKIWSVDRAEAAKKFKSIEEQNVDDEMVAWFYTLLAEQPFDPGVIARQRLLADEDNGRWVFSLPTELVESLPQINQEMAATMAAQCLEFEHPTFAGWDKKDLAAMMMRLAELANEAKNAKSGILMLLDATSAPEPIATSCKVRQLLLVGDELMDQDKYDKAYSTYQKAAKLAEGSEAYARYSTRLHYALGSALLHSGKYQDAIEAFEAAFDDLEEFENPAPLYFAIGRCWYDSGQKQLGISDFQRGYLHEGFGIFRAHDPKYYQYFFDTLTDLGRCARGWNDAFVFMDLHLSRELFDDGVEERVRQASLEGIALAKKGDLPGAIALLQSTCQSIPEVEDEDDEEGEAMTAVFLRAAIADLQYRTKDYNGALDSMQAISNHPYTYMRVGQCLLELGDQEMGIDMLARAYMMAGLEIFEEEDPKYIALLSQVLRPPAGQTEL